MASGADPTSEGATAGTFADPVSSARSRESGNGPATDSQPSRRPTRLAVVGHLDSKNRLSLPKAVRDAIHVGPGDSVFLNVDDGNDDVPAVRVVKAVNPLALMLDALAEDALRQYHAGETISFDDLMDELEIEATSVSDPDAN